MNGGQWGLQQPGRYCWGGWRGGWCWWRSCGWRSCGKASGTFWQTALVNHFGAICQAQLKSSSKFRFNCIINQAIKPHLFCGPKMKKELASGMGTTVSFSCRSAMGLGLGLIGISGSSSSSSPEQERRITAGSTQKYYAFICDLLVWNKIYLDKHWSWSCI